MVRLVPVEPNHLCRYSPALPITGGLFLLETGRIGHFTPWKALNALKVTVPGAFCSSGSQIIPREAAGGNTEEECPRVGARTCFALKLDAKLRQGWR